MKMRDQKSHCTIYIKLSMAGQQKESSASMIDISACKFPGFGGHFNLYIIGVKLHMKCLPASSVWVGQFGDIGM